MKTCGRCKTSLPLEAFGRAKRASDGLQGYCRECVRAYSRERRAGHRARGAVEPPAVKLCPSCKTEKRAAEFHVNRALKSGLQTYCIDCSRQMHRESIERNADAVAARRAARLARTLDTSGTKTCTKCHVEKPVLSFYLNRGTKDGRATYCDECQRASTRAWKAANAERVREQYEATKRKPGYEDKRRRDNQRWWLRQYGITVEQYDQLLADQGGTCAICQLPERYVDARTGRTRRLSVDHDHKTGRVRGLLCGSCNQAVGHFEDDHDRCVRAGQYLLKASDT